MSVSSNPVLDELMGLNTSLTNKELSNSSLELFKVMEGEVDIKDDDKFSNLNIFKDIITNVEDKVRMLTEEVLFLRKDSEKKDDTITQLLNIIQTGRLVSLRT